MMARKRVPALFVASGPRCTWGGTMQWFECDNHRNDEHPCCATDDRFRRETLEPLSQWLERHGLADYYDSKTAEALPVKP